jgi:hypothetical protein
VAPLVTHIIAHYLGADTSAALFRFTLPSDSAPRDTRLLGAPPADSARDTTHVPPIP